MGIAKIQTGIADDKNETAFANVIPVEIKTANQTNYAVGTHPEFIGAKVLIMGDIMTYFSKNGVKNLGEINVEIPVTVSSAGGPARPADRSREN